MILCVDPLIGIASSNLSEEILESMIYADGFQKSKGWNFELDAPSDTEWRTSSTYFDFEKKFQHVVISLLGTIKEVFGHDYALEQTESIQIAKYEPGQFYKAHWDYFNLPNVKHIENDRIATVILYLNDDFEGGQTNFNALDISVEPKSGSILYFQYFPEQGAYDTEHEGVSVTSGVKYIATLWIRQTTYN
jgi:prolyl 4-hydroxylase